MKARLVIVVSMAAIAAMLGGCANYAGEPVLYPVGSPVNPPYLAHIMCVGESNAMYGEAMRQYKRRTQMTGHYDGAEAEALSGAAARRAYITCASSEGYRAVYAQ